MVLKKFSDLKVRRVTHCLADMRRRSLAEVTSEYNRKYPPGFTFFTMSEVEVKRILDSLVVHGYVRFEVLTFTNEPIAPTKFYTLTSSGIQNLNRKR
jgi:DNA-binding PadR family transcriptional regulator